MLRCRSRSAATARTVLRWRRWHTAGMLSEFESVKNLHEAAVFELVQALAGSYPSIGSDAELLADVACVALNRMPPRYIRHLVDLRFYQDNNERVRTETVVQAAVVFAFEFVQSRRVSDRA